MSDAWCPVCERQSEIFWRCDECGKLLDGDDEPPADRSAIGGGA